MVKADLSPRARTRPRHRRSSSCHSPSRPRCLSERDFDWLMSACEVRVAGSSASCCRYKQKETETWTSASARVSSAFAGMTDLDLVAQLGRRLSELVVEPVQVGRQRRVVR